MGDISKIGQGVGQGIADVINVATSPVVPVINELQKLNELFVSPSDKQAGLLNQLKFMQQQQQQEFYRELAKEQSKRADEGVTINKERLKIAQEQARQSRETAKRLSEESLYKESQRPALEKSRQLEQQLQEQRIEAGKKGKINIYDQAYDKLIAENPDIKNDPERFAQALHTQFPTLKPEQVEGVVEGLKARGKLLKPASYLRDLTNYLMQKVRSNLPKIPSSQPAAQWSIEKK